MGEAKRAQWEKAKASAVVECGCAVASDPN